MRQKLSATLVTVLAILMIVPLAAGANEDTRGVDDPPELVVLRLGPVSDAPDGAEVDGATSDRPRVRPHDVPTDRVTDRVRDHRRRDRVTDHPNFHRRLVAAGCIVELPSGEWEWTGACGPDELPPRIRKLIHRLIYSHLWRQLYRLLHWLNG